VPRLLGTVTAAGTRVLVETALPGRPLSAIVAEAGRTRGRAIAGRATGAIAAWLTELGARSARPAAGAELEARLGEAFAAAAAELALDPAATAVLGQAAARARDLAARCRLPLVVAHNDLGPPNILCSATGEVRGIVDWESAAVGLPAGDLVYLLGRLEELFGIAHDGSLEQAYLARLGIEPAWLPILRIACWTLHARNEQRDRGPSSSRRHLLGALRAGASSQPTDGRFTS
jgi:aminoglycoside phosphotransferase